jgi:hypothetical protein
MRRLSGGGVRCPPGPRIVTLKVAGAARTHGRRNGKPGPLALAAVTGLRRLRVPDADGQGVNRAGQLFDQAAACGTRPRLGSDEVAVEQGQGHVAELAGDMSREVLAPGQVGQPDAVGQVLPPSARTRETTSSWL